LVVLGCGLLLELELIEGRFGLRLLKLLLLGGRGISAEKLLLIGFFDVAEERRSLAELIPLSTHLVIPSTACSDINKDNLIGFSAPVLIPRCKPRCTKLFGSLLFGSLEISFLAISIAVQTIGVTTIRIGTSIAVCIIPLLISFAILKKSLIVSPTIYILLSL
jgi:hypothetical protein